MYHRIGKRQNMTPQACSVETADGILKRLGEEFTQLTPQLRKAARYLLDHPHEAGVQSMRAVAAAAGVQPNTLVRLARHLGYPGYEDLRERFRDFLRAGLGGFKDRAEWLQSLAREGGGGAIVSQMAAAQLQNLEQMFQRQPVADLEQAADWILAARRVFILGVGAAYPLAFSFWYVARMAFDHLLVLPRHGSLPGDDLARIGAHDVLMAMTFQPYRNEILQAAGLACARDARVIGITDSQGSPLAREVDLALLTPIHTPQFFQSNSAVMALLETLTAVLVSRAGQQAAARIEDFHRQRWDAGIYCSPPD